MSWRLKWQLWKVQRSYASGIERLKKRNAPEDEIALFAEDHNLSIQNWEREIAAAQSDQLMREAWDLDVETPLPNEEQMWYPFGGRRLVLSFRGRAQVRKLVDAEKARRFEVKTLWVMKVILPLIASLIGIIGALTGMIAVLQHKK